MAGTFHVFGPANVQVGISGGTATDFGYTEDGVEITEQELTEDVFTDYYGPSMPEDVQLMGRMAMIRCQLIKWDENIRRVLMSNYRGGQDGTIGLTTIGTLTMAGLKYFSLRIAPTQRDGLPAELAYSFPYVHLVNDAPLKVGIRVSRHTITFRALMQNGILYTRS